MTSSLRLRVSLTRQQLLLEDDQGLRGSWLVSTSRFGPGEQAGSLCTPRGLHRVRARIGDGLPAGTVLRARRPTGEVLPAGQAAPGRRADLILTRILWLSGCEPGRNRNGLVDTMRRYIYIHGTPDDQPMGVPMSIGCIRMRNAEIVELFDQVPVGTLVDIQP
ncbi:MAG: L,D-transpeptidase [Chromatiales bacterium]|nr:L,D-transpeptidase [Chromatiales bacterium]